MAVKNRTSAKSGGCKTWQI